MNFEEARFNMIEQQLRPWNIQDDDVLNLLSVLKREDFVPTAKRTMALADMEIPLGEGQRMLSPRVEARMLQDAMVQKHEKVLEIGAGSGYMAALLAHRAQSVISIEIVPELAQMARANLKKAGIQNAEIVEDDGATENAVEGQFDVIMLSGSVAAVPQGLLTQLKVGGRLVAIVGNEPTMRATVITRTSNTGFTTVQPWDTVAQRLVNFPEASRFTF